MTLFYTYRSRPCSAGEASPVADGNKYRNPHTDNAQRVRAFVILTPNRDFIIKYHHLELREHRVEGDRKNINQRGLRTPRKRVPLNKHDQGSFELMEIEAAYTGTICVFTRWGPRADRTHGHKSPSLAQKLFPTDNHLQIKF